ncbi:MAG: TRAP transporter substrate-binding protein [Cyclobacteriaceae bacterium]|nr:TRAP transporter substrate-binding protein [Cyclobacteriaceae bacterium]
MGNEQHIWHRSAMHFAQKADSLSNGRIEVRVYPAEQLGKELDMIRSIKAGIADFTITGESLQNWIPEASFCGMPYLIRDLDHLSKVVDGDIGAGIVEEMIEKIGVRPVGYFARGARHLTSNRPIKTPEELKGIILRVPNVPISVQTWQGLGAKPTPMAFSEVFTALQQGTVEAQENPFSLIHSAGFYEVQKYVNLTGHVIGWVYVVMGEEKFKSLDVEDQEIILTAGRLMQEYYTRVFLQQEEYLQNQLKNHGMEFVEVDKAAFQKQADEIVKGSLPESILPLYQAIKVLK